MTQERYLKIYEWPNSNLQTEAPAWIQDVNNPQLQEILDDMLRTCKAYRGAGLAGPQVGLMLRVVVVLDKVYINPIITGVSERQVTMNEGCLSFPGIEVPVSRPAEVMVSFLDRNGAPGVERLTGVAALTIQHEIDHLNGKTFLDHMPRVKRQGFLQKMKIKQRQLMSQHKQVQKLIKKAQKQEAKTKSSQVAKRFFPTASASADTQVTT